eukprot:gene2989-3272_t
MGMWCSSLGKLVNHMLQYVHPEEGMTVDDLFSAGMTGLRKAVLRYNPARGTRFSTVLRAHAAAVGLERVGVAAAAAAAFFVQKQVVTSGNMQRPKKHYEIMWMVRSMFGQEAVLGIEGRPDVVQQVAEAVGLSPGTVLNAVRDTSRNLAFVSLDAAAYSEQGSKADFNVMPTLGSLLTSSDLDEGHGDDESTQSEMAGQGSFQAASGQVPAWAAAWAGRDNSQLAAQDAAEVAATSQLQQLMQQLVRFREQHGRHPEKDEVFEGRPLGRQLFLACRNYCYGKLGVSLTAAIEAAMGSDWDWSMFEKPASKLPQARELLFQGYLLVLQSFVAENGRLPGSQDIWQGVQIGQWVGQQQRAHRRQQVLHREVQLLEQVPGWTWHVPRVASTAGRCTGSSETVFDHRLALLRQFQAQHGGALPDLSRRRFGGVDLLKWMMRMWDGHGKGNLTPHRVAALETVRTAYRQGQLSQAQVEAVEAVPGWSWTAWEYNLVATRQYVAENGRLPGAVDKQWGKGVGPCWHDALANQFSDIFIGPGSAWASHTSSSSNAAAVCGAFPAATALHVVSSSTRDYPPGHTQELHELDDFDNLDPASLWDALAAAAAAGEEPQCSAVQTAPFSQRLSSLYVSGCFWNCPELFGTLKLLTGLTQLRLSNTPLETAWEAISKLPQLTLLTSLTPTNEPLQRSSSRDQVHGGLDLVKLLPVRSCLQGLDVAVMHPEHLANLGQFTLLQRLCLR